jgi:xanthine/CO dehydrogenase XdhC/CoxF family maturation factor
MLTDEVEILRQAELWGELERGVAVAAVVETSGSAADALARLRAPIGLDIGAVSPTEIAVAVMGEIVLTQRRNPLRAETARAAANA